MQTTKPEPSQNYDLDSEESINCYCLYRAPST